MRSEALLQRADARLRYATYAFAAAVILHNADHLRRGLATLSQSVAVVGIAGILLEVAIVILVLQRNRLAPLVATAGGIALAAGYLEVHFLPPHGFLSDAFVGVSGVSLLSYAAASLEVAAALGIAVTGWLRLSMPGHPQPPALGWRDTLRQPVVALILLTQAATLGVVVVQHVT